MNFCTNCGNLVSPDAHFCSKCGFKITNDVTSGSSENDKRKINELATQLRSTTDDAQKASFVRNVVIPDDKEDILDLMLLASSNVSGDVSPVLFDAWRSLFETCYQKASFLFSSEHGFYKIQRLYDSVKPIINDVKFDRTARNVVKKILSIILYIVFVPIFLLIDLLLIIVWHVGEAGLSPWIIVAYNVLLIAAYVKIRKKRKKS